jgi:hypothetical protein
MTLSNHALRQVTVVDLIPNNRSNCIMTVVVAEIEADLNGAAPIGIRGGFCKVPAFMQHTPHLSALPHIANLEMTRHQLSTNSPHVQHCFAFTLRHSALDTPALMATAASFTATGHLQVLRNPTNTSQEAIE